MVMKRDMQILYKAVMKLDSYYTKEMPKELCREKPRYSPYMQGIEKAVSILKAGTIKLLKGEQIVMLMSCRNVVGWFEKGRTVEPYTRIFDKINEGIEEIEGCVNFIYGDTRLLQKLYCNEGNLTETVNEGLYSAVDILKDMQGD